MYEECPTECFTSLESPSHLNILGIGTILSVQEGGSFVLNSS